MESTPQEHSALVREFLTEVLAGGDVEALDIFLTDGAIDHQRVLEADSDVPSRSAKVSGVLGAAEVDIAIEDVVAQNDLVAVRGTVTGTHRASLVDATATGRTFELPYAWFCRIEDCQIAEIWSFPDERGLRRALRRGGAPDEAGHTDST